MRAASAKSWKARLAAGLLFFGLPAAAPTQAQDSMRDLLYSSYTLWGMMDAAANFCWERANWDPVYMEVHQDWLARNVLIRDELDAALAASGEAPALSGEGEAYGSQAILGILSGAGNPDEACVNWKEHTLAGGYEAESFISPQLGILRERDGL